MRSRRRPTTDAIESAREDIEQDDEANDADDTARNAKEFFRRNTCEVIKRMQQPSDPANNIAANLIARYALDPRLRAEARRAIYGAQVTSEAKVALAHALDGYMLSSPTVGSVPST
jgi:hypothetical protein